MKLDEFLRRMDEYYARDILPPDHDNYVDDDTLMDPAFVAKPEVEADEDGDGIEDSEDAYDSEEDVYPDNMTEQVIREAFELMEKAIPPCNRKNVLAGVTNPMKNTGLMDDEKFMSNIKLEPRKEGKKLANRELDDGTIVTVRLDLNSSGKNKFPISTVHKGRTATGTALGYDYMVNLDDVTFYVNQKARADIASCKISKTPMAGSTGKINNTRKDNDVSSGTIVFFNPMKHHLFVDMEGYAVKGAKSCTNYGMAVFCKGVEYWSENDAPKPMDDWDTAVKFKK
jgi:hypothetical protein